MNKLFSKRSMAFLQVEYPSFTNTANFKFANIPFGAGVENFKVWTTLSTELLRYVAELGF